MTLNIFKKIFLLSLIFLLVPFLTGCVNVQIGSQDGGVFRSSDKGETWQQIVFAERIKKKKIKTISHVNVTQMVFNPLDSRIIYLATRENGAFFSENKGEKWNPLLAIRGEIKAIAPDPESKNIIYLTTGQKILKTTNQGKEWYQIYLETKPGHFITCLAIDPLNPNKIYAGISDGRLIRSFDAGKSWKIIHDFQTHIKQILINKKNPQIIYLATTNSGVFRTTDSGQNWQEITENLEANYPGIKNFKIAILDQTKTDALMIATQHGLLKTNDGGRNWQPLKLLTQPGAITIYSLALNPKNSQEIYYGTARALYKSTDGGLTWITKSLPTKRVAFCLLVDPYDPEIVFLGATKIKNQQNSR